MIGDSAHTVFEHIYAETADICLGDAWLPAYRDEWRGTNIVVVRSPHLQALLLEGAGSGEIELEELSHADMVASQGGNFRHRRVGVAVRVGDRSNVSGFVASRRSISSSCCVRS